MTDPTFVLPGVILTAVCALIVWRVVRAVRNKEKYRLVWLLPILAGLIPLTVLLLWVPATVDPFGNTHEPNWLHTAVSCCTPLYFGGLLLGTFVLNIRNHEAERNKWLGVAVLLFVIAMNGHGWMAQKALWGHSLNTILIMTGGVLYILRARPQGEWW